MNIFPRLNVRKYLGCAFLSQDKSGFWYADFIGETQTHGPKSSLKRIKNLVRAKLRLPELR